SWVYRVLFFAFRPFLLQPPRCSADRFHTLFQPPRLPRALPWQSLGRIYPQGRGSPPVSRLASQPGRIEFVILRTGRSLPVALHPLSQGRSYLPLQARTPA